MQTVCNFNYRFLMMKMFLAMYHNYYRWGHINSSNFKYHKIIKALGFEHIVVSFLGKEQSSSNSLGVEFFIQSRNIFLASLNGSLSI